MRLIEVLDHTNTIEKTSFYKTLNNLIEIGETDEIEEILNKNSSLKEVDYENINRVFILLRDEYKKYIKRELATNLSQLDVLIDIIVRDGNGILKDRWLGDIYKKELSSLKESSKNFIALIDSESKEIEDRRRRDYKIYRACVKTAYTNDELNNLDNKVTSDEFTLLQTLAEELELSNEEVRLINFSIVPLKPLDTDTIIKQLKDLSIVFYHKRSFSIYVPDEVVKILREIRGKSIADKYMRRIIKSLKGPQLNLVCKRHGISQRSGIEEKIKSVLNQGIPLKSLLSQAIHVESDNVNEKKKEVNNLMKQLGILPKGTTLEDKIQVFVDHFNAVEKDEKIGISMDGFKALCKDINELLPNMNEFLRKEFQFEEEEVLLGNFLANHNIKPRDILDILSKDELKYFCKEKSISNRGDDIQNILNSYTDTESIYIENFIHIGNRDLLALKTNNINISASEIGLKYEDVTKLLFRELGFIVNDELKAEINTRKEKIDILVQTEEDEIIIVECKTAKSKKYNKFSACSRQIKAYQKHSEKLGYRVIKTLLIAPDFTPDFIADCDVDYDLNLSLITSETLYNIWNGFRHSKQKVFPVNLLMRDAVISDKKILKALNIK